MGLEGRAGAGARRSGLATVRPRCLAPQPTRRGPFLRLEASSGSLSCVPGGRPRAGPRTPGCSDSAPSPQPRARPERSPGRGGDAARPALEGAPRPRLPCSGLPWAPCPLRRYRRVSPEHWTQTRGLWQAGEAWEGPEALSRVVRLWAAPLSRQIPLPWLGSNHVLPLATRMETRLPRRPTRGSLTSPSYLVRKRTLGPPLENNPKTPLASRDEGLRLLHGLETNLATSLQTPQEA